MARAVEVPAQALRETLLGMGFVSVPAPGFEEVFERSHDKDRRYVIRVFSTISKGAESARAIGEDAIRIVAVYRPSPIFEATRGVAVFKGKRVFRAGSVEGVLERLRERCREAYVRCNECVREDQAKTARSGGRAA